MQDTFLRVWLEEKSEGDVSNWSGWVESDVIQGLG